MARLIDLVAARSPSRRMITGSDASSPPNRCVSARIPGHWRKELNAILSENPGAAPSISEDLWYCAILERDVAAAERALATIPPEGFKGY